MLGGARARLPCSNELRLSSKPRRPRPTTTKGILRTAARWAVGLALVAAAAGIVAGIAAPFVVRGPRFGRVVERLLPATRGQIRIGAGSWSWTMLFALARGRPTAVALDDVRVIDPAGADVLRAAHVAAVLTLDRTPFRLTVRSLRIEDGLWRFATMPGKKEVGFLAALEPAPGTKPSAPPAKNSTHGRAGGGRARVDIEDATLADVDATVDLPDWGLTLHRLNGRAALHLGAGAARVEAAPPAGARTPFLTFELADADVLGGGEIRILGGRAAFVLPFSRGRLDRLATTAEQPDAIQLAASAVQTGRSRMNLRATFSGTYGVSAASRAPGMNLVAELDEAADAVSAIARGRGWVLPATLTPEHESLRLEFRGPFTAMAADTEIASPRGGRMRAKVSWDTAAVHASASFADFDVAPLVPSPAAPFVAGRLDGEVAADLDLRSVTARFRGDTLRLTRPSGRVGPGVVRLPDAALADGVVRLGAMTVPLWGGRVTASGALTIWDRASRRWMEKPRVDLRAQARHLESDQLLGVSFVRGALSLRARVTGTMDDLAVEADLPQQTTVSVLGEPFRLPERVSARLVDGVISTNGLTLVGPEQSKLIAAGRLTEDGQLALAIRVEGYPFARLPGLGQTELPFAGLLSGQVRLGGAIGAPSIAGEMAIDEVAFRGQPLGRGALVIRPGPRGAIRATGRLADGITASGVLVPERGGLRGEAHVDLERVALGPFLADLPGGFSATGTLSGSVSARIAPGAAATVAGSVTGLSVDVVTPAIGGPTAARHPVHVAARGDIPLTASSGEGGVELGPARLVGDPGEVEVYAQTRARAARATLRARLNLAPLAFLGGPWLSNASGAVNVDLAARALLVSPATAPLARAERGQPDKRFEVTGTVTIASPIGARLAAFPLDLRADAGRLRFTTNRAQVEHVALAFHAARLPGDMRGDATGGATVDADVSGLGQARPELTRVDIPVRGTMRALAMPGVRVDDLTFDLRLMGDPRARLALTGDVALGKTAVDARLVGGGNSNDNAKTQPKSPRAAGPSQTAALLHRIQLDVKVHAPRGAVTIDVPHIPDLRVGIDGRVGGTAAKPAVSVEPSGANIYSKMILGLRRLFD